MSSDLPVDGDGACMKCKATPPEAETLLCRTCATPWHVPCLSTPLETLASVIDWLCPDCSAPEGGNATKAGGGGPDDLVSKIRAIEADATLDEKEKARMRQALVSGKAHDHDDVEEDEDEGGDGKTTRSEKGKRKADGDVFDLLDDSFKCSFCMQLPERPVTTPCGHNFCLKCFEKWVKMGKRQCAKCRAAIPAKIASQPRINAALVAAIRMAKSAKSATAGPGKVYHFIRNESKPEKAFTTERAKRAGKANACSGKIFVTVPPDHFGPIPAENDPTRNRGVLVGDTWEDRLECRQWGAHFPHVAGIAGQSEYGAQSVALSGGYEDDEDHGEWFLYTGSGGRDLSGNKRTNKQQSFDQKFENSNQALRISCINGYPVRVVRSFKEKRSSYAPEKGVRYDGVYRIEKCWRKPGIQGFKVCRYLFVRCDNEPAPWTSDELGDRPRPLPAIKELKGATDLTERKDNPSWDYDGKKGWTWMKPPPISRKRVQSGDPSEQKRGRKAVRAAQNASVKERLLKEFSCPICRQVMSSPVSTPCGHNFCQSCLLESYVDKSFVKERGSAGGRALRARKIVKECPSCPTDISDFLQNPRVNRELMELIESLKHKSDVKELTEKGDEDGDGPDDLNKDGVAADENDMQPENGAEGTNQSEENHGSLDEKKLLAATEKLTDGALNIVANSPPHKRRKVAFNETEEDAVSDDRDQSPSSPLAVSARDDEI